tara:strand:- start:1194 stop:1409 length:216 start_codon:yes stop_codon:yes gene_type:complete
MTEKSIKDAPIINSVISNKCRVKLTVTPETKSMLKNECIEEFMIHHPELKGMNITEEFMVRQVIEHYLRTP